MTDAVAPLTYTTTITLQMSPDDVLGALAGLNKMNPMPGFSRQGNTISVDAPMEWSADDTDLSGEAPGSMRFTARRAGKATELTLDFSADLESVPAEYREMVRDIFEEIAPQIGPAFAAAINTYVGMSGSGLAG